MERSMIIKALECCKGGWCIRDGCPLYKSEEDDDIGKCTSELSKNALALIKELTEECENYKKVAEKQQSISMDRHFEIKRLTEENERLKVEKSHLECVAEVAVKNRDEYAQELHYLSNVEIPYLYEALEGNGKNAEKLLDILANALNQIKADTVREFAERFKELMGGELASCGFCNAVGYWSVKVVKDNIDRIANEILNENTEDKNGTK